MFIFLKIQVDKSCCQDKFINKEAIIKFTPTIINIK